MTDFLNFWDTFQMLTLLANLIFSEYMYSDQLSIKKFPEGVENSKEYLDWKSFLPIIKSEPPIKVLVLPN